MPIDPINAMRMLDEVELEALLDAAIAHHNLSVQDDPEDLGQDEVEAIVFLGNTLRSLGIENLG